MTTYTLTGKFVGDGAHVMRGGRIFAAFKPPGSQRNVLHEVHLSGTAVTLSALGSVPGSYFKSGGCSLAFDDATNRLTMLSFESANPATGGDAQPVLWITDIIVSPIGGGVSGTVDSVARAGVAALDLRLDKIAIGAQG